MKNSLRIRADHPSHLKHRRQMWTQVILPIALAALVLIAAALWTAMSVAGGGGDPARWAAIATIWLVLPFLVLGVLMMLALGTLAYLVAALENLIPPYSSRVQRFFFRIEAGARRVRQMAARPVLLLQELGPRARALIRRR